MASKIKFISIFFFKVTYEYCFFSMENLKDQITNLLEYIDRKYYLKNEKIENKSFMLSKDNLSLFSNNYFKVIIFVNLGF